MNAKKTLKSEIESICGSRSIAYRVVFAEIVKQKSQEIKGRRAGSANAALLLSQIVYWEERKTRSTIEKTREQWEEETGLTPDEQLKARKLLRALDLIHEEKKGTPCKIHFRLNREALLQQLREHTEADSADDHTNKTGRDGVSSRTEKGHPEGPNSPHQMSPFGPSLIGTENTSESTPEITSEITSRDFAETAAARAAGARGVREPMVITTEKGQFGPTARTRTTHSAPSGTSHDNGVSQSSGQRSAVSYCTNPTTFLASNQSGGAVLNGARAQPSTLPGAGIEGLAERLWTKIRHRPEEHRRFIPFRVRKHETEREQHFVEQGTPLPPLEFREELKANGICDEEYAQFQAERRKLGQPSLPGYRANSPEQEQTE